MIITIKIDTGNAAFDDGRKAWEVQRIIREWINAGELQSDKLFDSNGNKVGTVTVKGK